MISGMLHKRVYLIGGKPELVIYSDSSTGLDTIELRNELDPAIIPENDAIGIFLLGGVMADKVPVEISSSTSIIFSSQSVIIRSNNSLRFGDWYGKARTITDLQNRCAVISVPGMRYFNKDFVARLIFRPVLDRLLFEKGYIPLHASCAVKGEKACIIAGAAGSGKSTLLWGLLEKGMSFISDDRLLVKEKEGGPFYTHSFPEFIRLPLFQGCSFYWITPA